MHLFKGWPSTSNTWKQTSSFKSSEEVDSKSEETGDEEQDWEVENIIDVCYNEDGTKSYLIRWKGYDPSHDSWEPESNVDLVNQLMSKVIIAE